MKSNARFYASLGLLVLLNGIIKPVWIFGIDRQVQNIVGPAVYGTYFSLLNLSLVFTFLLDWGLAGYFNRQRAANPEQYISQAGNFLFLKIIFAIIYAGVVAACASISGVIRWDIVWSVIAIQVLTFIFVFLRAIITAEQWFITDAWLSVLDKGLMILLCGTVLLYPSLAGVMTIEKFLWFQITCSFIAVSATVYILLFRRQSLALHGFSGFVNKKLFLSALPYALLLLLMSVHFRLDGFLLERLHHNGAMEAGIYAAAYRLLDAANMVGFLFASFVLPYIARRWQNKDDISAVVLNTRHFLLLLSVGVTCFVLFFAPWIEALLYKMPGEEAALVMQWCLPALIGYSLVSIYGTVMTATGHIYPFCLITGCAVLVNTTINLLLIPALGATACCIAALGSQTFCGIACMLYSNTRLGIPFHLRSLLMYIFIGAVLCTVFYLGRSQSPLILAMVAIIITVLLSWITGLFHFAKLKLLFNNKQ